MTCQMSHHILTETWRQDEDAEARERLRLQGHSWNPFGTPSSCSRATAAILSICLCCRKWLREKEMMSLIPESYARRQAQMFLSLPRQEMFLWSTICCPGLEHSPRKKNAQCLVGRNFCPWTFTRLHCGNRSRSNCSLFGGPLLWQPEANSLCGDWHSFLLFISCHGYSNAETSCLASYLSPPAPPALLLSKTWPQAEFCLPSWGHMQWLGSYIFSNSKENTLCSHIWVS